jgi:hypothetical protein
VTEQVTATAVYYLTSSPNYLKAKKKTNGTLFYLPLLLGTHFYDTRPPRRDK